MTIKKKGYFKVYYSVWTRIPYQEHKALDEKRVKKHETIAGFIRCQFNQKVKFTSIKEVSKLIKNTKESHPNWLFFVEIIHEWNGTTTI